MKKSISLILCLCLIFCFSVPVHATATSWDTSDQSNLQSIMRAVTSFGTSNLYYYVSQIYSLTNTISNNVNTIKSYLIDSNHGVAYWVQAISTWMSPIYYAITDVPVDLSTIIGALGYTDTNNTYHPFLNDIYSLFTSKGLNGNNISLFGTTWDWGLTNTTFTPYEDQLKNLLYFDVQQYNGFINAMSQLLKYTNHSRYYTDWASLQRTQMSNYSFGDAVLNFLDKIQQPTARLSYVLASDERIEAQAAAAVNEEAVVDNFIDSNGNGSAGVSDITSISDLSSGFKTNVSTDASPSGFWDIFNSSHGTWFSQETYSQLDTTTPIRGSSFDTPYLDNNIQEIYNIIGGDDNK